MAHADKLTAAVSGGADDLAHLLRLAWEAGRGGQPAERAIRELVDLAVQRQVAVPTRKAWRMEKAVAQAPRYGHLGTRSLAQVLKVDRKTAAKLKRVLVAQSGMEVGHHGDVA